MPSYSPPHTLIVRFINNSYSALNYYIIRLVNVCLVYFFLLECMFHEDKDYTTPWCGPRPTGSMCCGSSGQIHMDYRNPVETQGWHGHSLSGIEEERAREPDPCLDRLLLLFWVHYIEDDPHLLCTGSCRWLPFTDNKGQNTANYFKEKEVTDQGGKWLNWLHSILGRFSTDFRKLKVLSKYLLPQSRVREF